VERAVLSLEGQDERTREDPRSWQLGLNSAGADITAFLPFQRTIPARALPIGAGKGGAGRANVS